MPWLSLIPVAGLCLLGAWLSYAGRAVREHPAYALAFTMLGATAAACYAAAVREADPPTVYRFNVAYDLVVLVAYSVFPLAVGLVRPDGKTLLAAVLIAVAAWLLRRGG